VCQTGVEEDALGCGGLTGVDVSHDADVARIFKMFVYFCHYGLIGIVDSMKTWRVKWGKSKVFGLPGKE
jgi:hypothetical protein